MLALLLVLHLPAAFGLAVLHGTWLPRCSSVAAISAGAYLLAQHAPGRVLDPRRSSRVGLVALLARCSCTRRTA